MLVYPQELRSDFMGYLLFYIVDYKQVLVFLSPSSETKKATVKYVYHSNETESTWSGLICKALHFCLLFLPFGSVKVLLLKNQPGWFCYIVKGEDIIGLRD